MSNWVEAAMPQSRTPVHWSALLGGAWLVLASLSGCATVGAGTGASATVDAAEHFTTASDETDAQRRTRIRLELASHYFERGQMTVALDEVKQVLALDPNSADAFNLRGLIFMQLKDDGLAEESFKRAAALRPGDPDVAHNYGWMLCQQQKYEAAEHLFQRALAQPRYISRSKTLMTLGLCQEAAGKKQEALQSLRNSYELDPGNPVVAYNMARLLRQDGDLERAQFYIRRLNNTDLGNAQSLWLGIKIEHQLDNTTALRQLGEQLQKRFPESPERAAYIRGAFNE